MEVPKRGKGETEEIEGIDRSNGQIVRSVVGSVTVGVFFVSENSTNNSNRSYFLSFLSLEKHLNRIQNRNVNVLEQTSQNK